MHSSIENIYIYIYQQIKSSLLIFDHVSEGSQIWLEDFPLFTQPFVQT